MFRFFHSHCIKTRQSLLDEEMVPLVTFDHYGVHTNQECIDSYKYLDYQHKLVPKGYTGLLQSCDNGCNYFYKRNMKTKFQGWFVNEVVQQINNGIHPKSVRVDTKLSTIKNRHFKWQSQSWDEVSFEQVILGWEKTGFVKYFYDDKTSQDYNRDI